MIYIIADDLTGANDTGVQFSKKGFKTIVSVQNNSNLSLNKIKTKIDVQVIDTETRESSRCEAIKKIREVLKQINYTDDSIIYKKVDSTLRGNIGIEIEEILNQTDLDLCIFTSSYPENHRIIKDGYMYVEKELLSDTEYYQKDKTSKMTSFVPDILKEQTSLPVGLIKIKDVSRGVKSILKKINYLKDSGKKIIVFDAVKEFHLKSIMEGVNKYNGKILYAGSAGLAKYISQTPGNKKSRKHESLETPVMIINGSRRRIMDDQINYLKKDKKAYEVKIDVKRILTEKEKLLKMYRNKIVEKVKKIKYIIVRPDPLYNKEKVIKKILSDTDFNHREIQLLIKGFLSELTATIVEQSSIQSLILSGGDTALGICARLGITNMYIIKELLPGIPLVKADSREYKSLTLVTKAGGFGGERTLSKLIDITDC